MRTERLNGILLSTLLVTSLMVPLLTMALVSVPSAQSYPSADNDHMEPTIATLELQIGEEHMIVTVTGPTVVERGDPYDPGDGRETIPIEIISMTLTSATPFPITVNESPTKDSTGSIQQQYPGYDFPADSFFDVYIQIQTPFGTFHNDDPVPMETTINAIPPIGSTYESPPQVNIPLKAGNGDIVGFIIQASHTIPPKYLDNLYDIYYPLYSQLVELYPEYGLGYLLTNWIDTNGDFTLSPSDKIDLTDENDNVTWWHVDNVTITMLVENLDNPTQIMYLELDPELFPLWDPSDPWGTWWHEIWPVFSRWYYLQYWWDDGDDILDFCDNIELYDEYTEEVTYWHVLEVKYDIVVSQIQPPKYLDNLYDLADPISTQLHELYPNFSRNYDLTSWTDTNEDAVLSQGDIIDMTDENGVVVWWNVDTVTITMLVENWDNHDQKMYLDLDPFLFPIWDIIIQDPISSWWHEIWPVFSRWYHLSSWEDDIFNPDGILSPSDTIDITDEYEEKTYWHVLDVKYDIIVQPLPPPPPENVPPENWDYVKENMPDLGQHSVNWCWTAAAANSIKWYAYHGYPELLDDPSDDVLDDNYLQIIPWPGCPAPENGFLRLLHEIAIDGLFPGVPDNEVPPDATFCNPINNDSYFYGLQEFIKEQGLENKLYVHEIVDNDYFGGVGIPPEDGENVIYDQPTFENYKTELGRSQDVLLQLAFKNQMSEPPYEEEVLDHIVTGVSFFDGGENNQWIQVSDPWTQFPVPFPGPDHNNLENRYTYESLQVLSEDPFIVLYTGETFMGPIQIPVTVVKLIYVSPIIEENLGVAVDIYPKHQSGIPGENLTYDVWVTNTGSVADTYDLENADTEIWTLSLSQNSVGPIAPSDNAKVTLTATIPNNENLGTIDNIIVTATSQTDNTVSDNDTCKARVVKENAKWSLVSGWNLVGFHHLSENDTPGIMLECVEHYVWYLDVMWKLLGDSEPFELGVGYWIWLASARTTGTTGPAVDNHTLDLIAGWNLVSVPVTSDNTTPENLFSGIEHYVWYLDVMWKLLGDSEPFELGVGYWVWLASGTTVTVPIP